MTNWLMSEDVRRMSRRGARLLMAIGCACVLASCGMLGLSGEKASWSQVTFVASDDMNNNSPLAVDVVLVSDDAMLARLAELPASKWFAGRADLLSTFPKSLRYRGWELVPGQRVDLPDDAFTGPRVVAAFVFANYPDPGAHRVRIQKFSGHLVVQLDSNNFSVADTK
ncbi:type VI secretion system protein [Burkholderia sp. D7]|nr:type VI secretion system protein [Burkholderia sp. D7]